MKIMLCCNAGMSTGLLVQKMQKEAAARGEEAAIEARPMNEAMDHINEADVILLGPQIGYAKGDFEKAVEGASPSPSSRWSTTVAWMPPRSSMTSRRCSASQLGG